MSEPEVEVVIEEDVAADEEMGEEADIGDETTAGGLGDIEPTAPEHVAFSDYLRSPIVELVIGPENEPTSLFAHQGLILRSPYFTEACQQFSDDAAGRRILLPDEDLAATSAVLEYLYRSEYFPAVTNKTSLEVDPSVPVKDDEGVGLLRHARVYTLAKKLGLPKLSSLAHRKIHLTSSNARGEIAYARYVYKETSPDDENVRKPIAAFWASRSYVLRHEAEQEFKKMCLEFPQFGFDVLSLVLDAQERTSQKGSAAGTAAGRKRQRQI